MFAWGACRSSSAARARPLAAGRVRRDLQTIGRRGDEHDRRNGFHAIHHEIDCLAELAKSEDLSWAVDLSDARDARPIIRSLRKLIAVTNWRRLTLPPPLAHARQLAAKLLDDAKFDPGLRALIQESLRDRVQHDVPPLRRIEGAIAAIRAVGERADAQFLSDKLLGELSELCDLADAVVLGPAENVRVRWRAVAARCVDIELSLQEQVRPARNELHKASSQEHLHWRLELDGRISAEELQQYQRRLHDAVAALGSIEVAYERVEAHVAHLRGCVPMPREDEQKE